MHTCVLCVDGDEILSGRGRIVSVNLLNYTGIVIGVAGTLTITVFLAGGILIPRRQG